MIGSEVRDDADLGSEMGAVVQLERRHLDRQPLVAIAAQRDVRERPPDISGRLGAQPRAAQQVRHQCGGRRLAVRARDGDAMRACGGQRAEAEVDLGQDRDPRFACGGERWRLRRHARGDDHRRGRAYPRQVVSPDVQRHAVERLEGGERLGAVGMVGRVARVHAHARPRQQLGRRHSALPQAHHRDHAVPPRLRNHRTFSVARAIAAHMTPRI